MAHQLEVEITAKLGESIKELTGLLNVLEKAAAQTNTLNESLKDLKESLDEDFKGILASLSEFKGGTITVEYSGQAPSAGYGGGPYGGSGGVIYDVTAKISDIEWADGHPNERDSLDGVKGRVKTIDWDESPLDTLSGIWGFVYSIDWSSSASKDDKTLDVIGRVNIDDGFTETISILNATLSNPKLIGAIDASNAVLKGVSARVSEIGFSSDSSRTLNRVAARVSSAKWEDGASKMLHSTIAYVTDVVQGRNARSINVTAVIDSVKWSVPMDVAGNEKVVKKFDWAARASEFEEKFGNGFKEFAAVGKSVATVAEGGVDEVVVHSDWLKKNGPVGLDKAVASVVRATPGGVDVAMDDFQNTAIIPLDSRYPSFKTSIFGNRFADGKTLDYIGAFYDGKSISVDNYGDIAQAMMALQDLRNEMQSRMSSDATTAHIMSFNASQLSKTISEGLNSLGAKIDLIKYDSSSLNETSLTQVEAIRSMASSLSDMFTDVSEDIRIFTAMNGDSRSDKAMEQLVATQKDFEKHLDKSDKLLGEIKTAVLKLEGKAPTEKKSESTYTTDPTYAKFKSLQSGEWALKYTSMKKATEMDDETQVKDSTAQAMMGYRLFNGFIGGVFNMGANITETLLKKTLGAVEDIYGKLKEASPLLQTVETLFNLAMRLFFMPLGNKLAEILIPGTIELVEKVTDMWDMFDGETSLGDMFNTAIDYGVSLFTEYFEDIGEKLQDQGGLIGSVGTLILSLTNFLENHGLRLLTFLMDAMGWVLEHIKTVISLIVAFKTMSYVQSLLQIESTITAGMIASSPLGAIAGGIILAGLNAIVPTAIGAMAGGATYAALTMAGFSEGGYIEAVPGGQIVRVAEGGEGEYVIPEHLMSDVIAGGEPALRLMTDGASASEAYGSAPASAGGYLYNTNTSKSSSQQGSLTVGGDTIVNYYINGYTDSELRHIITDTVNQLTVDSRVRGRYW